MPTTTSPSRTCARLFTKVSHCRNPPFPRPQKQTEFSWTYIPFSGPISLASPSWRAAGYKSAFTPTGSYNTLSCNLPGLGNQIFSSLVRFSTMWVNCLLTMFFFSPLLGEVHYCSLKVCDIRIGSFHPSGSIPCGLPRKERYKDT